MYEKLDVIVGDKVIVYGRYSTIISHVEKITPTGRIKVGDQYYDNNGRQIGGDCWSRKRIEKANNDIIKEIMNNNFIANSIDKMHTFMGSLSYGDAVKIMEILKNYDKTSQE